jgi:hydroxymethylpyrimidine/phosphomethylpyrimidine kinase
MSLNVPIAVTIAGSDSGGGAGIQADLKSFSANYVYGASVITALTAQNTLGVTAIHDVPASFISDQMDAVFSDLDVAAVKIGMLSQVDVIHAVAQGLDNYRAKNIVLDPVMVAESGDPLLAKEAISVLVGELFPRATLVTPNLLEAAQILDTEPATTRAERQGQATALLRLGAKAVMLKGGHGEEDEAADILVTGSGEKWFSAPRIDTRNTHGTGCSLSSAIAANLAHGTPLEEAVGKAKLWLTGAIVAADHLNIGKGHGPVHHFHNLWNN